MSNWHEKEAWRIDSRLTMDEMIELRKGGATIKSIAKLAGIKKWRTLQSRFYHMGIKPEVPVVLDTRIPQNVITVINDLYHKEGLSTGEIAKIMGVSQSTITRRMASAGIPRRPKREAISRGRQKQLKGKNEFGR